MAAWITSNGVGSSLSVLNTIRMYDGVDEMIEPLKRALI